jgi:hypothetical protein
MLLVGIAVDFTFLYQTRTQTAFASQAAAAQALRIAAATYALEVSYDNAQVANGTLVATPAQINAAASERAIIAGQTAGNLWFASELGNLSRATMTSAPTDLDRQHQPEWPLGRCADIHGNRDGHVFLPANFRPAVRQLRELVLRQHRIRHHILRLCADSADARYLGLHAHRR